MPTPRKVLNAFPTKEVERYTRLSRHMIDYLRQEGFLRPFYEGGEGTRGQVRYYSYRDLVLARLIQRLREKGVRLHRLKKAVKMLNRHPQWTANPAEPSQKVSWLITDGVDVYVKTNDEFVEEITTGQQAFAFVLNLERLDEEVRAKVPVKKRPHCSIDNSERLMFDEQKRPTKKRA